MKKIGLYLFLDRIIHLYLYYVVLACFLSLVPNINPDFPLFHYIFKFAGFYIVPPVFGISFSPMIVMITLVLISMGLRKLYIKLFFKEEQTKITLHNELINNISLKEIKTLKNNNKEDNQNDSN